MADLRPKRANAGKNIGKLVNQELGGDDFYSTAYGGFQEESEDEEYETEDSEDDQVDSDFDVDESGWGPDDDAETKIQKEEKEKNKKKQWIKPYKPPTPSKPPSQPKKPRPKTTLIVTSLDPPRKTAPTVEPRILRKSTQEISRGFRRRQEEEEEQRRRRKVRRPKQVRRLTQQELLEEAKYTEIENLASLEAYHKMEAEKKKVKEKKVLSWNGPMIRYLSLTMPVVEEVDAEAGGAESAGGVARAGESEGGTSKIEVLSSNAGRVTSSEPVVPMETNTSQNSMGSPESAPKVATLTSNPNASSEGGGILTTPNAATPIIQDSATPTNDNNALKSATPTLESQQPPEQKQNKQCRNFLVFTDTARFPSAYFPPCSSSRPQKRRRRFCPVTGLPAKYIDPLTHTPYATPFAFKVIRLRYASEAEEKCEKRLAQLSNWLEEKKKRKKMESV